MDHAAENVLEMTRENNISGKNTFKNNVCL